MSAKFWHPEGTPPRNQRPKTNAIPHPRTSEWVIARVPGWIPRRVRIGIIPTKFSKRRRDQGGEGCDTCLS